MAVGDDLLIADPSRSLGTAGALMLLGGPAIYLLGESLFRLRMIGSVSPKRVGTVALLCALMVLRTSLSALALSIVRDRGRDGPRDLGGPGTAPPCGRGCAHGGGRVLI